LGSPRGRRASVGSGTFSAGLLGRGGPALRHQRGHSVVKGGEGDDHVDDANGDLFRGRESRSSSRLPREPGSVIVRNAPRGRIVEPAHLRTWHPAARPYSAFCGGSVKLASNGRAVLDHCSDWSGIVVGSSSKPNNVKGGNHGQRRSQIHVGIVCLEEYARNCRRFRSPPTPRSTSGKKLRTTWFLPGSPTLT